MTTREFKNGGSVELTGKRRTRTRVKILFSNVFVGVFSASAALANPGALFKKVEGGEVRIADGEGKPFDAMPPNEQSNAVSRMEGDLGRSDVDYTTREEAKQVLLYLNDALAIKYFTEKITNGEGEGSLALGAYGREAALPYLIPIIRSGAKKARGGREFHEVPPDIGATRAALLIIKRSETLPKQTRAWAESCLDNLDKFFSGAIPQIRSQVLEWWEHDGDAIAKGDSPAATWLPAAEIKPDFLKITFDVAPAPPPAPSFETIRTISRPTDAPNASNLAPGSAGEPRTWRQFVLAGLVVFGSGILIWIRRLCSW